MKKYFNYNGRFFADDKNVLSKDDRSYRYGDGVFETMKLINGNILLRDHHFERLFSGLEVLKFHIPVLFTKQKIEKEIKELGKKNECERSARIRLSVSRGNGRLSDCDNKFSYLIECWPLEQKGFNENGLIIDIFPDARKSIDVFSNLKSANYLPYVMAAIWAKENRLNDVLILNQHDRICDSTIANVFWIKDNNIFTPPLSEGCVAGVMRKKILELATLNPDYLVQESVLTREILLQADEVFLTNAIAGIRWVKEYRNKVYQNTISGKIFPLLH
ncbi:MAG: 4-amino-4-deoxychorismate lyase [Bacteroidetes bacterium]|nr:MAG: 4-amino-4-deoxychorismate lyase [Bacteroidota bacterium]